MVAIADQISDYPVKAQSPLLSNPPVNSWTLVDSSPQVLRLRVPAIPISRRLMIVLGIVVLSLMAITSVVVVNPGMIAGVRGIVFGLPWDFLVIFATLSVPILSLGSLWNSRASWMLSIDSDQIRMVRTTLFGTSTCSVPRKDLEGVQVRRPEPGNYKVELIASPKSMLWSVRNDAEAKWVVHLIRNHLASLSLDDQRRGAVKLPESSDDRSAITVRKKCPHCHQVLFSANISSLLGWAKCSFCDQVFSSDEATIPPAELNVVMIPPDVDVSQKLKTTKLEESLDTLALRRGRFVLTPGTLSGYAFLVLLGVPFILAPWLWGVPWSFVLDSPEQAFWLPRSLLLLLSCLISIFAIGPIGFTFWELFSSYEIRIDQESLTVIRRSLGFVHATSVPRSSLFCVKRPDPITNLGNDPSDWSVQAPKGIEFVFDDRRFILPMDDQFEADLLIGKINYFRTHNSLDEESDFSKEVVS